MTTAEMTETPSRSLFDPEILRPALWESVRKLDPRVQVRNPVMFVVEIGAVDHHRRLADPGLRRRPARRRPRARLVQPSPSPSGSGSRSSSPTSPRRWPRAAAAPRRRACGRCAPRPRAKLRDGSEKSAAELVRGDVVVVEAGEGIPGDGTVIEGIASVDESAITGESAPVIREAGGDRSAVTGGTQVLSDRIVVEITQEPGGSFLDRMIALVEGAARRKTPNEIALGILLAALTLVFILVDRQPAPVRALRRHRALRDDADRAAGGADPDHDRRPALGDRDRRHGPPGAPQRARPLRPRGRGLRRLRRAAARQDRDDHARQPRGDRVHPDAGGQRGGAGRGGADVLARRRDPGGPLDRRPRQGSSASASTTSTATSRVRPLHRRDPDERRRLQRHRSCARAPATRSPTGSPPRAATRRPSCGPSSTGSAARAAPRWRSPATSGCSASSTSRTSSRRG